MKRFNDRSAVAVLAILGKDNALARIRKTITRFG
jgi:hypothetical protein